MDICYWESPNGNVGDDLNPWLWPKVLGTAYLERHPGRCFWGIGSVLDDRIFSAPLPHGAVVFGAGMRGPHAPQRRRSEVDIRFVRGPLTAAALAAMGWGDVEPISDPAILAPLYATPSLPGGAVPTSPETAAQAPASPRRSLFIPYFDTPIEAVERVCRETGLEPLPVTCGVEQFIATLRTADRVVTEAMHGAILADAFRIPWAPCRITSGVAEGETSEFKWDDWRRSLDIETAPIPGTLPYPFIRRRSARIRRRLRPLAVHFAARTVRHVLRQDRWHLSRDSALKAAQDRILEAADSLVRDRP